ncbi:MAG: bifunctional diaminohydroxyphosphoribosylaminopyrimidine deaminase/5-amino-6-(5-phosphoribosylamino)uracil reductase RibD [Thermoleophilia bacterium]|nr:bifunctional diaminohydroxyphosphoribosylaminopyrimidine deaminase/5-amino-6-(5-phosphoribosylamino)uracil reductase RibD [Thermoleophilia bacterium]
MSADDTRYLEQAISLAEQGRGCTSPNPMVGAVIVRGSEVLGFGYHVGPGYDHAEVAAIKDALRRAGRPFTDGPASAGAPAVARSVCAGSTIYVNLEPCCTYGRTPPCTDALISGAFARVVVGAVDPSPAVDGKGVEILREAGIQVDLAEGDIAHRAKRQNDGGRKAVIRGLPFVTYKYAMTLDGRVATDSGDSRWISSSESRALVHRWRAWSDAVVVGAGTLAADDPQLTARDVDCERQPLRVAIDRALGIKRESALVATVAEGPVVMICGAEVPGQRRAEVESWGVETVVVSPAGDGGLDPVEVGRYLVGREIHTVLLEGGPGLAGAWWRAGLIDRVAAFVCPRVAPGIENRGALRSCGPSSMSDASSLREVEVQQVGPDVLVTGYREGPF